MLSLISRVNPHVQTLALVGLIAVVFQGAGQAQSFRYGVGLQAMGSTAVQSVGPGFHARTTLPLTQDLSAGGGIGFSAFVLEGQSRATYALDPEVSLIVTLPNPSKTATYLLGGGGYHLPFGNRNLAMGPSFHLGLGRIWVLQETTLFLEATPSLYVRQEGAAALFPVRAGVIF